MTQHWSLRTRFVIFAIACLIPLLIVVVFFLDRSIERNSEELVNSETTLSTLVNQTLTNYLNANYRSMEVIANIPAMVSQDDPERINAILGEARTFRPELSGIFLINNDDIVVGESGTQTDLILPYIDTQIDSTISTGQRGISQRIDLEGDTSVIVLTIPVTTVTQTETTASSANSTQAPASGNDTRQLAETPVPTSTSTPGSKPPGTNLGVIGAVIQIDNLNQSVIPVVRARTEIAVLSENQVIASSGDVRRDEASFLQRLQVESARGRDGETGSFSTTDANGVDRVGIYAPVQLDAAEWSVIITNPTPQTYINSLWIQGAVVLALAGLTIIGLAVILGEITARPLRRLAQGAVALQKGDFSVPFTPAGGGEILTLSTAMSEMANQLRTQMAGLQESQRERQLQTDQMRDLLRRTMRLQEDERRRIASEIHDAVSPLITGALYQARALQMTNGSTPHDQLGESLQNVNGLLERASEELHGVIFDLRPPDLDDIGVVAAIEAYVSSIQRTGLECRLEVVNDMPALTPEVRLGIYRIVQEALHNVLRHAGADEAVVRLESSDNMLRVTIRDNGAGFNPVTSVRPTSLGLLSMRERAAAIGASFTILSRPGGGTAIVIERADPGSIMSDDVLADLMNPRQESPNGHHPELVENDDSDDNRVSDDAPNASRADAGLRDT
jgi:signal transduction histidine kinase